MSSYIYGFGSAYGYGKGQAYNPLIKYLWNTTTDENGVRYLDNIGTSKAINDAEMFSGRVISLSSTSQQDLPLDSTKTLSSQSTISFTAKMPNALSSSDLRTVFSSSGFTSFIRFNLTNSNDDSLGLRFNNEESSLVIEDIDVTEMHTYTIQRDGVNANLYIDGVFRETIVFSNTNDFEFERIGALGINAQYFNGDLGNLVLINQPLTPTQIKKLHTTPETFIKRVGNDIYLDGVLNTNVVSWVPCTMLAQYEYDLATDTQLEISNFTTSCRDNQNENKGYQSAKATKDNFGMVTGLSPYVEHDNISYANNNWDGSGVWQLERVDNLNGTLTHFVYDSSGNKFTNGVADGTYIIPTLPKNMFDGNTFDGVSTVTQTRLNNLHEGLENVPLELYNKAQGLLT